MVYNVEGKVMRPFIVHKGNIQAVVQRHFKEEMIFCQTDDGKFNQLALIEVMDSLQRLVWIYIQRRLQL